MNIFFKYLLGLIFLLNTFCVFAQKDSTGQIPHLGYISYNWTQTIKGKFLPSNGLHTSLGLNVAAFFKAKFILGPFADIRVWKSFGSNKEYGKVTPDINANLYSTYGDQYDSTRAEFISKAFNNDPTNGFVGTTIFYWGIMFCPRPDDHGSVMLMIKKGNYFHLVNGAYGEDYLTYGNDDYTYLSVPVDFNIQLMCKPFNFGKTRAKGFWKNILFSVFYERINIKNSLFDDQPLERFLSPEFFQKYGREGHFGVKLSVGDY